MKNIGIDQPLSNSALFEHRCLQSINKLYKHDGKCENQKQFKDISRPLRFLLLKDSPITVPDQPRPHQ